MPAPLLAVDAPFVLYRSFYALPDSIHGPEGRPVNALLGAVNLLLRIAADRGPRAIVLCFGAEAAAYRTELYPEYHAARPPVPDALAWQFQRAPELFSAFARMHPEGELSLRDLPFPRGSTGAWLEQVDVAFCHRPAGEDGVSAQLVSSEPRTVI